MPQPRATTLFHFTKNAENLYGILKNCFYPRMVQEDVSWLGHGGDSKSFAFPMVCFCDIPLSRIEDHVAFYGGFGLGLTREWAIKNQLNPIFYISRSSPIGNGVLEMLHTVIAADQEQNKKAKAENKKHEITKAWFSAMHVLSHMKPLNGQIVVAGKPVNKDFYLESEWRFVPVVKESEVLTEASFADTALLEATNKRLQTESCLRFAPNDVRYIFVPTDSDIPRLVSYMNENLTHHSVADMRILTTRVMSLDSIRDM